MSYRSVFTPGLFEPCDSGARHCFHLSLLLIRESDPLIVPHLERTDEDFAWNFDFKFMMRRLICPLGNTHANSL